MRLKFLRQRPIGTAFTVWSVACFLVASSLIVVHTRSIVRTGNEATAKATARLHLREQTEVVRGQVDSTRSGLILLAQALSALPAPGRSDSTGDAREQINNVLRTILETSSDLLGVFACWDPRANDSSNAVQSQEDQPGAASRFMPYWQRTESGSTRHGDLLNHRARLLPDYYEHVRDFRTDVVIDGLPRAIDGRRKEFITLLVPIMSENEFLGVAGVDLDLAFLERSVADFSTDGRRVEFLTGTDKVLAASSPGELDPAFAADTELLCSEMIEIGGGARPWKAVAHFPGGGDSFWLDGDALRQVGPVVLVLTAAFLFLWLLTRTITKPLHTTTMMLKEIAQGHGDLTRRLDINVNNEVSQLATWFNAFVTRVHHLVQSTTNAAGEVAASAAQVAASCQQLAGAITKVASQSQEASDDALNTGRVAEQGEKVVTQTIEGIHAMNRAVSDTSATIEDLSRHSTQIHGIITTIHSVAQQTNLLALNAAIEAARAGEAGRGFAVVADEVKQLARQTTEATKDIEECLHAIHTKTDLAVEQMARGSKYANSGVENARLTSASLERIVFGTRQFTNITSSISSITSEAKEAGHRATTAAEQLAQKAMKLQNQAGKIKL